MKLIPDSRRGALWRFALGGLIVVAFTATTTAVAGLLQFKQIAHYFDATPALKNPQVTIPDPGNPQTILIIGSDHRAGEPFSAANTDTMMLVRLDPDSSTINVLSIPRDLKVNIPQGGVLTTAKLNSAYSVGGPNLLIKVIRNNVFPGLRVNHIIDVNFGGFQALVDAIGCVYTDVDHRYYNNTALTNYSSIDIQPGYQKLCGTDALSFVRFRHTDSDIVRSARQQDFIRWAKDQYGPGNLIANRDKLLKIFGQHVQTDPDLHTVDGLINLFDLVAFSAGHTIKQIQFPAILLPCGPVGPGPNAAQTPCYVTADPGAERQVFHQFMTPTVAQSGGGGGGGGGGKGPAIPNLGGGGGPTPGLTADIPDGKAQAAALGKIGMPIYFPRLITTDSHYCTNATCTIGPEANSYPRPYLIHDPNSGTHSAYRMTLVINPELGQYYGVQGTTWQNPPILAHPTQTRMIKGKRLMLFVNGHKLSTVAWRAPGGVYWISNTLTDDIPNKQMVTIAASLMAAGA